VLAYERLRRQGADIVSADVAVTALEANGQPQASVTRQILPATPAGQSQPIVIDPRPSLATLADGSIYLGYQRQLAAGQPARVVVTRLDSSTLAPTGPVADLSSLAGESSAVSSEFVSIAGVGNHLIAGWSSGTTGATLQVHSASLAGSTLAISNVDSSIVPAATDARLGRMARVADGSGVFFGFEGTPMGEGPESIWLAKLANSGPVATPAYDLANPPGTADEDMLSSNWPSFGIGDRVNLVSFYRFNGDTPGPQIMLAQVDASGAPVGTGPLQLSQEFDGEWGARYSEVAYLGPEDTASGAQEDFAVLWLAEATQSGAGKLMYSRVHCAETARQP
jgi:hypothetical protein